MASIYGYIRTSRQLQEGVPGMDPASQVLQIQRAGVPKNNIFRDVGISGATGTQERKAYHQLNGRLAGGDTLVVVAIDRIDRRWPDTIRAICGCYAQGYADVLLLMQAPAPDTLLDQARRAGM